MGIRSLVTKLWFAMPIEIVDGDGMRYGFGIVNGIYILGLGLESWPS